MHKKRVSSKAYFKSVFLYFMCLYLTCNILILSHDYIKKEKVSNSKFISIFIVFRNPRIKSFLLFFFLYHLQQGRMRDKLNVMPFPAGAMHYRMGWNGRGGRERYIKCFCQQFSYFNRKKGSKQKVWGWKERTRGSVDVTAWVHVK